MPLTGHAAIRYQALDRCLSNRYKEFHIDDLLEAYAQAIYDYDAWAGGTMDLQLGKLNIS